MAKFCPGQDLRFWKPEDIFESECPNCGVKIEFFKDDISRRCPGCGQKEANPSFDFGCAQWCEYAQQCLGDVARQIKSKSGQKPVSGQDKQQEVSFEPASVTSYKQQIISQMKRIFGHDLKRIQHALTVLSYAEKIMAKEGGDPCVVIASAILHDIGIKKAEEKYSSSAAKYQEKEGPPLARNILKSLKFPDKVIDQVCKIIGSHHSGRINTTNFNIVWDADWLVNFSDEHLGKRHEERSGLVDNIFRTVTGHNLAKDKFLK